MLQDQGVTICSKCGKPAWAPYIMLVTKKYDRSIITKSFGTRTYGVGHPKGLRQELVTST